MRIIIDYNGSIAECSLLGCLPNAQDPDVNPFKQYNFKEADKFNQIFALGAFRAIEEDWKREKNRGGNTK